MGSAGGVWRRRFPFAGFLGCRTIDHPDEWICKEDTENTGARNGTRRTTQAGLFKPKEMNMKNDVENYIERRKRTDKTFAKDFEAGYAEFKIGLMLREAREQAGVTQEKLARITKTKKSAISRLENHAEDVRLCTVVRVARALGKTLRMELIEAKS